jgi:hypothetical protein
MTNLELQNSFDYFINTSRIPYDIEFFDSFNKNTNISLKTDFMIVIFSSFNDNLIPDFLNYFSPYIFMFTDLSLIYNLLNWCFNFNHPNYFKYILNNIYNVSNEDIMNLLLKNFNGFVLHSQITYLMYQFIQYIIILKKYNYSNKLNYEIIECVK